jgi:hypothetical protein
MEHILFFTRNLCLWNNKTPALGPAGVCSGVQCRAKNSTQPGSQRPLLQLPLEQLSFLVQKIPSSQLAPSLKGYEHTPVAGSQVPGVV